VVEISGGKSGATFGGMIERSKGGKKTIGKARLAMEKRWQAFRLTLNLCGSKYKGELKNKESK